MSFFWRRRFNIVGNYYPATFRGVVSDVVSDWQKSISIRAAAGPLAGRVPEVREQGGGRFGRNPTLHYRLFFKMYLKLLGFKRLMHQNVILNALKLYFL